MPRKFVAREGALAVLYCTRPGRPGYYAAVPIGRIDRGAEDLVIRLREGASFRRGAGALLIVKTDSRRLC